MKDIIKEKISFKNDFDKLKYQENDDINIIKFINEIIENAIKNNASDIHIETYFTGLRIRYRVNGKLKIIKNLPNKYNSVIVTRIKLMAKLDIAEKRLPQDGRIDFYNKDKKIDLRISTIPAIDGEKIVIRILDCDNYKIDKNNLGIDKDEIKLLEDIIKIENGMILITGPTGSGKTTTLYSLLSELNKEDVNIVTVEDPVEYKISGINQIQINEKVGVYFDNTLRFILRQDPDIILVGEIRDYETASTAIRAGITGHKVFSTLHTTDAYSTLVRLIDMGVEDYLIKASVNAIISQRLVRKLCDNCKEKTIINSSQKIIFDKYIKNQNFKYIYEAKGCEKCVDGYSGRIAIMEILKLDDNIINSIDKKIDIEKLRKIGKNQGVKNILEKGLIHIINGNCSYEDIMSLSLMKK